MAGTNIYNLMTSAAQGCAAGNRCAPLSLLGVLTSSLLPRRSSYGLGIVTESLDKAQRCACADAHLCINAGAARLTRSYVLLSSRMNLNVIRTWAFADGERPQALQRRPGVLDESVLKGAFASGVQGRHRCHEGTALGLSCTEPSTEVVPGARWNL